MKATVVYPYALAGPMPTAIAVVAGTENKTASLTYAIPIPRFGSFALAASAPLSETDARTPIVQLSGLANKATIGGRLNWGYQRLPSTADAAKIEEELNQICTATPGARVMTTSAESGLSVVSCDFSKLMALSPTARQRISTLYRTAYFASLKGDVGRQSFAFADGVTFTDQKANKVSSSGGAAFGALIAPVNLFASLGVRWENGYADADRQAVCGPRQADQTQACPLKIVGAPANERRGVVEFELRKYLPAEEKHPVGVALVVRHDWMQNQTSLEIPLYIVKDKDGGLSGGVSVGNVWSSDPQKRGARLSVFVGQAFGLAPSGS